MRSAVVVLAVVVVEVKAAACDLSARVLVAVVDVVLDEARSAAVRDIVEGFRMMLDT